MDVCILFMGCGLGLRDLGVQGLVGLVEALGWRVICTLFYMASCQIMQACSGKTRAMLGRHGTTVVSAAMASDVLRIWH